ncbi:MAG: rhodanese-like domain-containing protein, partial [Nitrospirales bacterium]
MLQKKLFSVLVVTFIFVFGLTGAGIASWGSKELDTEKIAVNLAKEVMKGGYKIVTTEELKGWLDQKKTIL